MKIAGKMATNESNAENQKMKTKLKILKVRNSSFQGREGDTVDYFWVKAERFSDGVTLEFGTKNPDHEAGEEKEIDLEKNEDGKGGYRYKERAEEA